MWKIVALISAVAVLVLAVAVRKGFINVRKTSASNACVMNLRHIEGAKETWALDRQKKTNEIVLWDDITPYLSHEHVPRCPDGGTYTLGRVGEPPRCSLAPAFVGGKSHEIPK